MSNLRILHGDSAQVLQMFESESVHLVVTSPPYDNLRTYDGHSEFDFKAIAREMYRVLAPGGVVCWNVNDSVVDGSEKLTSCDQKIFFRRECGFLIHDTMIYEKSNGSKPNPHRYNQVMEYIFILSKGVPKTVNLIHDKPNVTFGKSVFGLHTIRQPGGEMKVRKPRLIAKEYGTRGNVWRGNTRGQEEICQALPHPAMMPKWLARDLILSWSNTGDTVLDPFMGSGTTLQEAIKTGRNAIGIDKNPQYVEIAIGLCNITPGLKLM